MPVFKSQEPRGSGVAEVVVVWSLGGEKPLHSLTPTSLVRRAIALGWRSELTDVQRTTEYIDLGIEHTPCRNELRIIEYKIKEVPNMTTPK